MSIECTGLYKSFGPKTALREVSFQATGAQAIGLLGQNGAGKSTLLNILAGIILPDKGEASINGQSMTEASVTTKESIGYLSETAPLYDEMTVKEYVRFLIALNRVKKADRQRHYDNLIDLCNLGDAQNRLCGNLSHGFRQRVALCGALCGKPDVLLLDEPTTGLDPSQLIDFRRLIDTLSQSHIIILSSHTLSLIESLCSRVILLNEGHKVLDRSLKQNNGLRQYLVKLNTIDRVALPILRQLPSVKRVTTLPQEGGKGCWLVESDMGDKFPHELFAALSARHIALLTLTPMRQSLEDVYLATLQGENNHDHTV